MAVLRPFTIEVDPPPREPVPTEKLNEFEEDFEDVFVSCTTVSSVLESDFTSDVNVHPATKIEIRQTELANRNRFTKITYHRIDYYLADNADGDKRLANSICHKVDTPKA